MEIHHAFLEREIIKNSANTERLSRQWQGMLCREPWADNND